MFDFETQRIIKTALSEDMAYGDITTQACIPQNKRAHGYFIAKEDGVICGLELLRQTFSLIDDTVCVTLKMCDGQRAAKGGVIAEVEGPACSILKGERTALNFVQHLSGISTRTADAVACVKNSKVRITDTRKTTPGLRALEKYAVRVGGGNNHRFSLSDGVLIKDNHIVAAGGITAAVTAARRSVPHTMKIEVEISDISQIDEALEAGADIIMLDNMTNTQMEQAVKQIGGRALTEASGNMGSKNLSQAAATGVDIISIGALTHSAQALDISLKFEYYKI